ncbi:MAG: HAMP domain-containing sensor histidine kinase [Limnoraphis robusta]|uniref:histidine kinase n=1 Tax=Limnoraphis robusta CS-951 TaxID=1637645 RepID=A0A0F5YK70_9CYAN|nr:HAMP domain-containing sensor histidine kinase [Limnoraphis robusta]KKD39286.1 histidine kinase [Limnoraphis robusta CS-951]
MFQATRRRLAIWYTSVTAVLLLLFVCGFFLYFRNTLIERIDDTLNHVVEVIERSLVIESVFPTEREMSTYGEFQVNIEASFRNNAHATDDDRIDIEWFSPTGELLWSTLSEPLNLPLHFNRNGETVHIPKLTQAETILLRQVTDRIEIGRQVLGYLRISHPWFEVTKPTHQLMIDLTLGAIAAIISAGGMGWFLSGLAIAPVRESYQRLKQFTADASHELRSPIATIQTNVQVSLAEPDLNPNERQQLQVIERLTRRLGRLVDDLLFLARSDSGIVQSQFVAVPLDAVLMEVVEEQNAIALAKKIRLKLDLVDPPLPEVETSDPDSSNRSASLEDYFTLTGDWDQLVRLFTNLVDNAIQHTPEGGEVRVQLQWTPKGKRLSLSKGTESGEKPSSQFERLQVLVSDTGMGIPPEALPQIFDRFYRVDPSRSHRRNQGSGLGLAIAQAIVQNHQGQIRIDSEVNQGTTVTVILPVHRGE